MYQCHVCSNEQDNTSFIAREMMIGLRDQFEYFECSRCGCLQIAEIPSDISKYYPSDYYSLNIPRENRLKQLLKRKRARYALGVSDGMIGRLAAYLWGTPPLVKWLKPLAVDFDDAILDVGSGAGRELLDLRSMGFTNLTGIDPYLEQDLHYGKNLRVLNQHLNETEGTYDLLLMNHVFEHLANPRAALEQVARLLPFGHYAIIRTPVAGSYAWRTYQADWVQLDAPRHLYIHSEKSICMLAKQTGFEVWRVVYDSDAFQFYGSEQYRRDIPLRSERSYSGNAGNSPFTRQQIRKWEEKAAALNRRDDGDQACFYLRRL